MNYPGDHMPYTKEHTYKVLGTMTAHLDILYQRIPTHNGRFYAALVQSGGIIKTTRSRIMAALWRWRYRRYEHPGRSSSEAYPRP